MLSLLPPRSALGTPPPELTPRLPRRSPRPPTSSSLLTKRKSHASHDSRFSAILFQGCRIRQVSCYTLLSGFRLPWPPSCCLNSATPFLGSVSGELGWSAWAFGSSRIASPGWVLVPLLSPSEPDQLLQTYLLLFKASVLARSHPQQRKKEKPTPGMAHQPRALTWPAHVSSGPLSPIRSLRVDEGH